MQRLFDVTHRLISEQKLKVSGESELSWGTSDCEKLSPVNDQEVIKLMKANVDVFSDSVLCVGNMREFPHTND